MPGGKVYYSDNDTGETVKTKNFILLYYDDEGIKTIVSLDAGKRELVRLVQAMLQVSVGFMREISGSPVERQ